jgi:hypothetical protein
LQVESTCFEICQKAPVIYLWLTRGEFDIRAGTEAFAKDKKKKKNHRVLPDELLESSSSSGGLTSSTETLVPLLQRSFRERRRPNYGTAMRRDSAGDDEECASVWGVVVVLAGEEQNKLGKTTG